MSPILNDPAAAPGPIAVTLLANGLGVGVAVDTSAMVAGGALRVWGATAEGFEWPVRGGMGVVDGSQVVLADVMAPLNVPLVYSVTDGADTWSAEAVTRPWTGEHLLSSLDGRVAADLDWQDNGDPVEQEPRYAVFGPPGAEFPVVRYDGALAGGGVVQAWTSGVDTAAVQALVRAGRPVGLFHNEARCDIPGCDIPPVQTILITRAPRARVGTVDVVRREWNLSYLLVADPEPGTPVPVSTWDEFDTAHANTTWASFDTAWATRSWDELDRTVWGEQA